MLERGPRLSSDTCHFLSGSAVNHEGAPRMTEEHQLPLNILNVSESGGTPLLTLNCCLLVFLLWSTSALNWILVGPQIPWGEDRDFPPALDEKLLSPPPPRLASRSLLHPTVLSKEVTNGATEKPRMISGRGVASLFLSEGPRKPTSQGFLIL